MTAKPGLIAIDPGASGGIAWIDTEGIPQAVKMPEGMTGMVDMLLQLKAATANARAIVERVGGYVPGNSGPGAVTFAAHCGEIRAALYALGIPAAANPTPQSWMKAMGYGVTKYLPAGYKDMIDADRKRARDTAVRQHKAKIKERAARRYPHLKVTLNTADALEMLAWATEKGL